MTIVRNTEPQPYSLLEERPWKLKILRTDAITLWIILTVPRFPLPKYLGLEEVGLFAAGVVLVVVVFGAVVVLGADVVVVVFGAVATAPELPDFADAVPDVLVEDVFWGLDALAEPDFFAPDEAAFFAPEEVTDEVSAELLLLCISVPPRSASMSLADTPISSEKSSLSDDSEALSRSDSISAAETPISESFSESSESFEDSSIDSMSLESASSVSLLFAVDLPFDFFFDPPFF